MRRLSPLAVALATLSLWILGAALLPVVQDEAYYFSWAAHPDLGYFDHPPLVALMGLTARVAGGSPLVARLGTLLAATLTLAAAARFFRAVGLGGPQALGVALALAFGNLMGLVYGFIATPDTLLMLAWVVALTEAALALRDDPRRWLTAGLATGAGLWAKYTMLAIGPVFLWAMIAELRGGGDGRRRPSLRTPWPYLGGAAALLVFAPQLWWNANHDWITVRFQMRHGFAMERPESTASGRLPEAEKPQLDSPEWLLGSDFAGLEEAEKKAERRPQPYDEAVHALNAYAGYYASQLALWGGVGVALALAARRARRRRRGDAVPPDEADALLSPGMRPLAVAAAAVPLLAFGALSLVTKVEANWSAMYVFGAAALLAPLLLGRPRLAALGVLANVLLVAVAVAHARTGFLPTRPHRDRLLAETHGYADLAGRLAALSGPVFADSYQITAMTTFLAPTLRIRQWPGITRDSEYIRRPEFSDLDVGTLRRGGFFWLVTTDSLPPHLPGFLPVEMTQLRDCKDGGLQVISSLAARRISLRCRKAVHEWFLIRYVNAQPVE